MEKQRVELTIAGGEYIVRTTDDADYVNKLSEELDDVIRKTLKENPNLSLTQAAVLTALNYGDTAKKATESADVLRGQINGYIEEATLAKLEVRQSKQEIDRLKKEIKKLEK